MADRQHEQQTEVILEKQMQTIVDAFVNIRHLSRHDFLKSVFDSAFELIPTAEKGSYYELEEGVYRPIFSKGYDIALLNKLSFTEKDMFIGFEVDDPNHIEVFEFYNRKRDDSKFSEETIETFKALGTYYEFTSLYTPIRVDGINVGLLCCERFDGKPYDTIHKLTLKLYAQLISNFYTQLVHREKENQRYTDIINAMVSAIEVKDKYTEGHAKRVTDLAVGLGAYMGLPADRLELISTAAILHDIGKIGVRSDILVKPGRLTDEEYRLIQEHPVFTKKILENIGGFEEVVEIAYLHHEFYNGKGYPQGLAGEEIPLESAIISVVDAFDAMTSDRSYREAMSEVAAFRILEKQKDQQFNGAVVEAFLSWQKDKNQGVL